MGLHVKVRINPSGGERAVSQAGARLEPLVRALWGADGDARVITQREPIPTGHVVVEKFMALPSLHRPRLLLPTAATPTGQARLLRMHNEPPFLGPRSMLPALRKAVQLEPANTTIGTPIRVTLPVEQARETLRHLVGWHLDIDASELALSLSIRDEAGWPTVRITDLEGSALAFVKIGTDPVQIARLGQEQSALNTLQIDTAPRLLTGSPLFDVNWHGRRVIANVAMALDGSGGTSPDPATVLSDLQASQPMQLERLRDSGWMHLLRQRVGSAPKALQDPLHSHLDRIDKHYGHTFYAMGRTHGDWLPWHMARSRAGSLAVWDWEHSHPQAPLLLDTLHWHYGLATILRNRSVASGVSSVRQQVRTMNSAPPGLAAVFFAEQAVRRAEDVRPDVLASREIALRALRALALAY